MSNVNLIIGHLNELEAVVQRLEQYVRMTTTKLRKADQEKTNMILDNYFYNITCRIEAAKYEANNSSKGETK